MVSRKLPLQRCFVKS
uniref:Uncharacterized protein n=1 Tax=Arundo donax TaxID=35708 RepID=A0A0A9H9Q0_ARUDO